MRTVLALVVTVVAAVVGQYYVGPMVVGAGATKMVGAVVGALATGAITAVGMMAVNAIAPPATAGGLAARTGSVPRISSRQQSIDTGSRSDLERSPSLSGGRNQSNRYGPVPRVLGTHKLTEPRLFGRDSRESACAQVCVS